MDGAPPKVVLPLCVDASVRIAQGRNNLGDKYSEKNAKKDAAFEAGVALYKAGLLNDHLMPLLPKIDMGNELGETLEKPPSMVQAKPLIQPWVQVAQTWLSHSSVDTLRRARLVITEKSGTVISEAEMILPVDIPSVPRFTLHWDDKTEYLVETLPSDISASPTLADVRKAQQETTRILMTAFDWRFPIEPSDSCAPLIPAAWMREAVSLVNLNEPRTLSNLSEGVLIRDKRDHGPPFVFEKYLDYKPGRNMVKSLYGGYDSVGDNVLHLALKQLPRRTDFLHRVGGDVARGQSRQNHTHMSCQYYIDRCVVDGLPFGAVQLGILLPSILHRLEVYMVAQTLSNTILQDLELNDLSLLVTAISASSASEESNYQRFEFFGDSLLKMCVSVQLLAEYPLWHEGYLSQRKDQIVSNTRLCNAALDLGLDRFIITKSFTGRKWRPLYVRDVIQQVEAEPTRKLSSKVLADVVEALFHAAYVDGGVWKALKCMQLFLPEIQWQPLEARRAVLFERGISGVVLPAFLQPLEDLIGYSFQKKSFLIEAMTHASCQSGTASLERLEFLGDAVLDSIIVNELSKHEPELSHVELHRLRTAFVNADFLAFMCMEWSIEQEVGEVLDNEETHTFECTTRKVSSALWRFMLRGSHSLSRLQRQAIKRHEALREAINTSLETGSHYPWALLARLLAPKFNSDIVESLLGAVYVDSGSWDVCTSILERLGILPYARRVLRDAVHTLHPKEELGMLAVDETVNYNVEKDTSEGRGIRVFVCEVLVGERSIATISDGLSIEEAKTRAAEAAVTALKQRDEMS
jgi:dsRNA-specific ribonuclease